MFAKLAFRSLLNRKGAVSLTIVAMSVSMFVLLGVENIRHQAKESFSNTVSGVDLIVGARTGRLNLLLYSVFRIGAPTNEISWSSYQMIRSNANVAWAVPMMLGDSHRGYRVLGTSQAYFDHMSYGNKHNLEFSDGERFQEVFDVVLGASVASKLNYQLGDTIVIAHGIAKTSFTLHDDHPFKVVGILEPTGTPIDQTLHVSMAGIEAVHSGWQLSPDHAQRGNKIEHVRYEPKTITAVLLGLKSRISTFQVQSTINRNKQEPLTAILPGVALSELWQMMGVLEKTLQLISILVFFSALLGLSSMLLSSIQSRQQEIHLLRVIGASPSFLFFLLEMESLLITFVSLLSAAMMLFLIKYFMQDYLTSHFGLYVDNNIFTPESGQWLLALIAATLLVAAIPSVSAFKEASKQQ